MNEKIKNISISKLIVNPENYRHNPVDSQEQAIKLMLHEYKKKIKNLCVDIIKNGINPTDLICVTPIKGNQYIVLEGNRRITALKLINNVDILKSIDEKLHKEFSTFIKKNPSNNPYSNINCLVFDDPKSADRWILLKHTGENDGIGTVSWEIDAKRRFSSSHGKDSIIPELLDYISFLNNIDDDIKSRIKEIPITNLERVLGDPHLRESLGFIKEDKHLYRMYPNDEMSKGLSKILDDLINKKITVRDIYTKKHRLDYISKFKENSKLPNEDTKLENPIIISTTTDEKNIVNTKYTDSNTSRQNTMEQLNIDTYRTINDTKSDITLNDIFQTSIDPDESKNKKVIPGTENTEANVLLTKTFSDKKPNKLVKSKKDINNRKNLIPRSCNIKISNDRINQIYKELKTLDIEMYTNAVSVMFRVFIELSIDDFISRKDITIDSRAYLKNKVDACLQYLKNSKLIDDDAAKPVQVAISNHNSIFSISTFNSYVHNRLMFPDVSTLKIAWNNLSKFIELLHLE